MKTLAICILSACLGAATGLRTFVAPAAICWGAHLGWIDLQGSWLAFLGKWIVVALVTVMAAGEIVFDKLPFVPNRTDPFSLCGRIASGAFSGAALSVGTGHYAMTGALAGVSGAVAGAFGGFHARRRLVRDLHLPDLAVALVEDLIAISAALLIVSCARGL